MSAPKISPLSVREPLEQIHRVLDTVRYEDAIRRDRTESIVCAWNGKEHSILGPLTVTRLSWNKSGEYLSIGLGLRNTGAHNPYFIAKLPAPEVSRRESTLVCEEFRVYRKEEKFNGKDYLEFTSTNEQQAVRCVVEHGSRLLTTAWQRYDFSSVVPLPPKLGFFSRLF